MKLFLVHLGVVVLIVSVLFSAVFIVLFVMGCFIEWHRERKNEKSKKHLAWESQYGVNRGRSMAEWNNVLDRLEQAEAGEDEANAHYAAQQGA